MIWWFLILAASAGAVLWATVAAYLRVHRHMQDAKSKLPDSHIDGEVGGE